MEHETREGMIGMAKYQTPRGTRDFMPWEMVRRQYLFDVISRTFESFGFAPLETPAFESWELLGAKGGGGEAVKDEVYMFKDKGGREMGLRFDLTVPMSRVVAGNPQLQKPFKRYQIGRVWRYDNPQAGRFREFWQADVDIIGSSSMAAEAECIAALTECLDRLGFRDFKIRLNSRKILNGMVEAAGIDEKRAPAVFRALDKLEKQGRKVVEKELRSAKVTPKQASKLMSMVGISGSPEEAIGKAMKILDGFLEAKQGLEELEEIVRLSGSYATADKIEIDLSLVRGLDYYTGPIYEIKAKTGKGKDVGSLAGCGRYDNLIEMFGGQPSPATGGSLGIERIYEIMIQEGMFAGVSDGTVKVFVSAVTDDQELIKAAIETAQKLRAAGIAAETDVMGRKFKKGLEYADSKGIPYIIIIGEKELKTGKLTVKDLKKRTQKSMTLGAVLKMLKK
jgi:histidyl-tRNA synthetase